ncbi:MAG TPA: phospholipase D-like domain-containing protein [Candidatus Baltobacteraceae bacterium]|nr:phospholipase D-like domain-containing protein [Candidatus Baltobacteraceae bacterium]
MVSSLKSAQDVTFSSYFLRPGPVENALFAAAARRREHVHVRLEGTLYRGSGEMAPENRYALERLHALRADVRLVHRSDADGPGLHIKAAVCDGVAFLDDRNWNVNGDTVVRDDTPSHVRAIRDAILHREADPVRGLALSKWDALDAEAHVLRAAAHAREVDVETEYLGGSLVSKALRELRAKGVRTRVIVSEQAYKEDRTTTRVAAKSLAASGVDVRIARASEKIAVAGTRAWIGSANATSTYQSANAVEWSLSTSDKRVVHALQQRFNARWREATPVHAPSTARVRS